MALQLTFLRCASCPLCNKQAAILGHAKGEAPGDVEFREVRIDSNTDQVARYHVTTHLATILERDGRELRRWTAVVGKVELLAAMREFLGLISPAGPPIEVPAGPVSGQLPGRAEVRPLPGPAMPSPGEPAGMPPGR